MVDVLSQPTSSNLPVHFSPERYASLRDLLHEASEQGTLVDQVYDQLLIRIIRGELPSGAELKSTQFATELDVSRTPVNQAFARLLADGIISQQPNYRAVVCPGAENWLVDIHELRQQVEPRAAELAAGRLPQPIVDDLMLLANDVRTFPVEAWRTVARFFDYALHLVVAEFCGNLAMRETIRRCWRFKHLSYEAVNDTDAMVRRGYDEHLEILQHLLDGNSTEAARAMASHLSESGKLRVHQRIV